MNVNNDNDKRLGLTAKADQPDHKKIQYTKNKTDNEAVMVPAYPAGCPGSRTVKQVCLLLWFCNNFNSCVASISLIVTSITL